ncbi:MAG: MGDG synthase family glycosyltransferase [Phycisphaerae bacterium]
MEETTNSRPRVLFVSATVGAGHNSAARAIMTELHARAPQVQADFLDILSLTSKLFRLYYAGSFELGMTRLPGAYGKVYRLTNRPHTPGRSLNERIRLGMERLALRRFGAMLKRQRYDLLVHTHFIAPPHVTDMKRRGVALPPQFVVATDYCLHRFWYSERVDRWFLPADESAEPMDAWGIDPATVTVSGVPIHPKWDRPVDRAAVLQDWNLPADKDIVLLSGGTEYTCGPIAPMADQIASACPDAHVVVIAGRNKKLLAELSKLPRVPGRITPQGFTDRLNELGQVASLFVTKPGGITTTECVASATPMVLTNPVHGQEGYNAEYFASHGAAVIARGGEQIVRTTSELLNDRTRLQAMQQAAEALAKPGRETIVTAILRQLDVEA